MRATRRNLTLAEQKKAALSLRKKINQNTHYKYAQRIALYLANDGEVNTQLTIKQAWQNKQKVYLPALDPIRKGFLWFVEYKPDSRMRNNRFGIAEPDPRFNKRVKPRFLNAIGLPLVAFDSSGNRLGMGGGFYDRSFEFCRPKGVQPKLFGLAHHCQQVDSLPVESWDIQLKEIISV
jgi:5-formyltetrahydrofolate cyclo-ligase